MAYRYGDRYQMTLLPKSIEDYVGAEYNTFPKK